jgi:hypothetical protein
VIPARVPRRFPPVAAVVVGRRAPIQRRSSRTVANPGDRQLPQSHIRSTSNATVFDGNFVVHVLVTANSSDRGGTKAIEDVGEKVIVTQTRVRILAARLPSRWSCLRQVDPERFGGRVALCISSPRNQPKPPED